MRKTLRKIGLVLALAGVLGVAAAVAGATQRPSYQVSVRSGLEPRLSPDTVVRIVLEQLGPGASVDSLTVVASGAEVHTVESNASLGPEPGLPVGGPVWVARAHGRFVGRHTPPGVPDFHSPTGYFVIDDATALVRSMGMP